MNRDKQIVDLGDRILITGASGFIGTRVVAALLSAGYTNLCVFVRPSSRLQALTDLSKNFPRASVNVITGNLLSPKDCNIAVQGAAVIYHLAAASEKSFAGSFMNCVVTTRNLMQAASQAGTIRRFVNVSSFAVYSNQKLSRRAVLDENCEVDGQILDRAEAYAYAKLQQEQLVVQFGKAHHLPYVIIRPGVVYGPGAPHLSGRIGIDTFGIFFHLGGSNPIPVTYVDNCAQAIVLAGIQSDADGKSFNVVDDDLPTSRQFLRIYKRRGRYFHSIRIPYWAFYAFSALWEKYSSWSQGQLPPVFNRNRCRTYWKGNRYSNQKLKEQLGWKPQVSFEQGMNNYCEYVRSIGS